VSIPKDRELFRIELDDVEQSADDRNLKNDHNRNPPLWTVDFQNDDSEDFRKFSREAGLEEGPGIMESLFEIESPQERLDLLCALTGDEITSPWEETDMTGGQPIDTPNDA